MGDLRHILNGVLISEPRNWQDLEISYNFKEMDDPNEASLNINSLEFAGKEAIDIRARIMNGLSGGVGILEGEPYQVEVGEEGNPVSIFNGYLDFVESEFISCNEVKVALKKRQGSDWLNDVADSFSFRYLHDIGVISSGDFIKVPYVINYVPDTMQVIVLSISLFMMTKELVQTIRSLAEAIGDTTDASTPVVGTSVGLGAGVVTAWDIGNIILTVLKVAAYLAYTVAIVIAIKNLIEELIEQLMPKKREHLGMRLYTLFERSCQHLGLNFSSTLLNQRREWVIIPTKGHKGGSKPEGWKGTFIEKGVPTEDDQMDTFGDLIRFWKPVLNADFKIVNGTFYFERSDYWDQVGIYQLPDVFTDQENLKDVFKPNANEAISNYNIHWDYDTQDQNTLDNQEGRVFQAILEPVTKVHPDLINLSGLVEIPIRVSMGQRKDSLTKIEEAIKKVAKFIDELTAFFGSGTSYVSKIEGRKGSLLLSSHFLTKPKIVVMSGSKLAMNQKSLLSARRLWDELHYIRSFVEINGVHNQWWKYEQVKVPFCWHNFIELMDSNFCNTVDGEPCKIETLKWRVWEDFATIDYRVRKKYTNNLRLKYIE